MRVLLVEDEPLLGQAVQEHIAADGHAVDRVSRLDEAEAALRATEYGLVLLDLHLPDGLGINLLRGLRRKDNRVPVIILTARDQIRDRVEGLNAGADDYLVKPFDLDELSARVLAVSRRYTGNPNPVLRFGSVEIDRTDRRAWVNGAEITLTGREWAVLDRLSQRVRANVSKEQLEETLYEFGSEVESNAVEVYVSKLRKKLGRDIIKTVRGVGYRLMAEQ